MNALDVSVLRPSHFHLDAAVLPPLLVLLHLGLLFESLCDELLPCLLLALLLLYLWQLLDVSGFDVLDPADG